MFLNEFRIWLKLMRNLIKNRPRIVQNSQDILQNLIFRISHINIIIQQSNLCTTAIPWTQNLWPLLKSGRCSMVGLCYRDWNSGSKTVVAVGKWSLAQVWLYSKPSNFEIRNSNVFFQTQKYVFSQSFVEKRLHWKREHPLMTSHIFWPTTFISETGKWFTHYRNSEMVFN